MMRFFLEIKSKCEDGELFCLEDGETFSEEEAVEVVKEAWSDMVGDYYSWDLEKIIFHESVDTSKELEEEGL